MNNRIEKFLEFNGKRISVLLADGSWWVAIKPICEALGVDFEKQRERISRHRILGQLPTKQGVVAADGKVREMLCLPEKYIYGWIFSINSDSEDLLEYQQECYEILYNHFHSVIVERANLLVERVSDESEIKRLEKVIDEKHKEIPEYKQLLDLKAKGKQRETALKQIDNKLAEQLSLFPSN